MAKHIAYVFRRFSDRAVHAALIGVTPSLETVSFAQHAPGFPREFCARAL